MDDETFVPERFDYLFLYLLVAIGSYSLFKWFWAQFFNLREKTERAAYLITYKYITDDRKVIRPGPFEDTREESIDDDEFATR